MNKQKLRELEKDIDTMIANCGTKLFRVTCEQFDALYKGLPPSEKKYSKHVIRRNGAEIVRIHDVKNKL